MGFSASAHLEHQQVTYGNVALPQPGDEFRDVLGSDRPTQLVELDRLWRHRHRRGPRERFPDRHVVRMRDVGLGVVVDGGEDAGHLAEREGLWAGLGDHASAPSGVDHVIGQHHLRRVDVRQHRFESGRVDDLGTLQRDRQHLLDERDEAGEIGGLERRRHRASFGAEACGDIGVRRDGDDAATLTLGQQRHHHERGEAARLVGDDEHSVRCDRQLDPRPGVDADRFTLLRIRQRHHTDAEHHRRDHEEHEGHHAPHDRATGPPCGDRSHADAP